MISNRIKSETHCEIAFHAVHVSVPEVVVRSGGATTPTGTSLFYTHSQVKSHTVGS